MLTKFKNTAKYKRMTDYGTNWNSLRAECLKMAANKCAKCGASGSSNVHHIIPLSKGGRNIQSNLQCLCENCHISKHRHLRGSA